MQSLTAKLVASVIALFFLLFFLAPASTLVSTEVGLQNMLRPSSNNQKPVADLRKMLISLEQHQGFVLQDSEFRGRESRLVKSISRRSVGGPVPRPPSPRPNPNHTPNPTPCC